MNIERKSLATTIATLLLCASTSSFAASVNLDEFYNVEIKHLTATVDSVPHEMNISVTWNYKLNPTPADYIDSNLVISEVKKFLTEYPNKSDFFEVVNHNLTSHMMDKFKQLHGINIKISVPAIKADPYDHYTQVNATR